MLRRWNQEVVWALIAGLILPWGSRLLASDLDRYHEIRKHLDAQQFEQADRLLKEAQKEFPDSLRLKSMHYLFYAYLSRTERKLDAARHAEADMKLWLKNIQETPATATLFTQRVNTLTRALRDADRPELAEQKLDQTIDKISSIADSRQRAEFAVLLMELKVLKATFLIEIGKSAEGRRLLKELTESAKNDFSKVPDEVINIMGLAHVLLAHALLPQAPAEKEKAREEFRRFITAQAELHSSSNLVLSKYLAGQLAILEELVEEDAVAAGQQLQQVEDFLAALDTGDTGAQSIIRNAARPIDALRRHIERARAHQAIIGQQAIPLEAHTWVNGEGFTAEDLAGKVVLLDFWAMWCKPCLETFPHLRAWQQKYSSDGLVLIGVTQYYGYDWDDESKSVVAVRNLTKSQEQQALRQFARHHELPQPIAVLAEESQVPDDYGISSIPQTVVIDRRNKVRMIRVGSGDEHASEIETMLRQLLEESPRPDHD